MGRGCNAAPHFVCHQTCWPNAGIQRMNGCYSICFTGFPISIDIFSMEYPSRVCLGGLTGESGEQTESKEQNRRSDTQHQHSLSDGGPYRGLGDGHGVYLGHYRQCIRKPCSPSFHRDSRTFQFGTQPRPCPYPESISLQSGDRLVRR